MISIKSYLNRLNVPLEHMTLEANLLHFVFLLTLRVELIESWNQLRIDSFSVAFFSWVVGRY
jgi:hypothetical protein